jgi:hypothetical protein
MRLVSMGPRFTIRAPNPSLLRRLISIFAVGLAGLGCQGPLENYPPPVGGCPVDSGTCNPGGGGAMMGTGGSSVTTTTGTGGSIDQPGTVVSIASPLFASGGVVEFTGPATIEDLPSVGGSHTATYGTPLGAGGSSGAGGGVSTPSFDLVNVPAGPSWLLVQDLSNGAAGIFSTFSAYTLPVVPSVTLPVLDQSVLTNIASNLPNLATHGGVSTAAAHVVLMVTQNNAPAAGISVTGGAGGGEVVYDVGPGTFSEMTTATSTGGTIIIFNAGLQGPDTITLTNASTNTNYSVPVETGQGVVTLVSLDLG